MRQYIIEQVNKLYGPPIKFPKKKLVENPPDMEAPTAPVQPTKNWQAFIRVKKFAIQGTWGIHVFLGEPPMSSFNWYFAEARVGTVTILPTVTSPTVVIARTRLRAASLSLERCL
jgi:hypothetical protein